jgi:hypothetical protein
LIAVLVGLVIIRPGVLEAGGATYPYRLLTTLIAVVAVGYIGWRFHGIPAAAAAIALLLISQPSDPDRAAMQQRHDDAFLLTSLAIGIAAGSRQGRPGMLPWVLIAIGALGCALFGWYGLNAQATDLAANVRTLHIAILVTVLSALLGLIRGAATWRDRLLFLALIVGIPAATIALFRLSNEAWPTHFESGEWPTVLHEWENAIRDGTWAAGSWSWTTAWVVASLMLVGVWRTVMRGLKEWKQRRPPLAWLLTAASVAVVAAIGARPLASGSLALAAIGAILSVFGVADLILSLVERIELRPPEPGPSNIPRVK